MFLTAKTLALYGRTVEHRRSTIRKMFLPQSKTGVVDLNISSYPKAPKPLSSHGLFGTHRESKDTFREFKESQWMLFPLLVVFWFYCPQAPLHHSVNLLASVASALDGLLRQAQPGASKSQPHRELSGPGPTVTLERSSYPRTYSGVLLLTSSCSCCCGWVSRGNPSGPGKANKLGPLHSIPTPGSFIFFF